MNEPSGSYAPRSPDLTPLSTYPSHDTQSNTYPQPPRYRESFSLPSSNSFYNSQQYPAPLSQQQSQPSQFSQPPAYFRQDSSSLTDPFAFSQSPGPLPAHHQSTPLGRVKQDPADDEWIPPSAGPEPGSAAPFPHMKQEDLDQFSKMKAPGEDEGIVVRTKFPVARIKRIVQADEDVGKVAQVTPVVVSKALELFMISLALKTAEVAKSRNSKRVTASHLKQVVLKDEQFDFLSDIVSKIQDAPTSKESKSKAKEEDDDDDDIDSGGGSAKRRKPATRRKRKDRQDS